MQTIAAAAEYLKKKFFYQKCKQKLAKKIEQNT